VAFTKVNKEEVAQLDQNKCRFFPPLPCDVTEETREKGGEKNKWERKVQISSNSGKSFSFL
jgi:hypothetical protein